ncbi:lipopolysaccharide biosynthesis protein [Ureibacillus manganicus]|uniref:Teichoic acid transporter n=1 Tax=Ureibacillus manganicus DSM 26584 TaxID=1384049 RepID=A0A0A3HVE8_9BACL|nr:teichoic acid transporter [Ureibacillus manganicus]KGR76414.1 teichoic acid transporter [Ureibacillus manganicus DSM 26584]
MRIKNSLLNYSTGIAIQLITLILSFVSRTIFINTLGVSYLGVNGLMINVMSMLSIAELGIGTAITFSLYKPLATKDTYKISLLMNFYKKAYTIIGIAIFLAGMILLIFIDIIVKDPGDIGDLWFIMFLYVIQTSFPYFINYKVTLLKADQKEYQLGVINLFFTILTSVSQILVLIITHNFILYLISNIIILFIQTVYINFIVTRMYPILNVRVTEKLPIDELKKINKNIKAMVLHKIGSFSIHSTDNILISAFISVKVVGFYSNYTMIINAINSFITLFFNSIAASMGNLIATESNHRKLEVFKVTNFIAFWIYSFASISFLNLLNPTIELWLGKEYLLSIEIILLVLINFYLTGMRMSIETVKSAAGLYDVDKFSPLIQSAVNLVFSIILVQEVGLIGVFIGTIISSLVLPTWQKPYLVYKYVFKTSSILYFKSYLKYLVILTIIGNLTFWLLESYFADFTIENYIIRLVVCAIIPNALIMLFFYRTEEFRGLIGILQSIFMKGGSKNNGDKS